MYGDYNLEDGLSEEEAVEVYHSLFNTILAIDCKPGSTTDYAKGYASRGLAMTDLEYLEGQIPYLLSNLQHWRGDEAQLVKATLRYLASL